jgi:hypothetical protein
MSLKLCSDCHETKPLEDFYLGGHRTPNRRCKACQIAKKDIARKAPGDHGFSRLAQDFCLGIKTERTADNGRNVERYRILQRARSARTEDQGQAVPQ